MKNMNRGHIIGKFDIISKSYWPVFFDQVKNNLQSIFNFREPDIFIMVCIFCYFYF